ncbi:MAG: MmgE/PrpD family protein [Anaerolineae bacterium]
MDGNDLVAEFILDTTWDALPAEVQHKARQTLLDALGATLVGTLTPVSKIAASYATTAFRGDEATILLHGARTMAAGAAFANGYSANGIDIDDCAKYTRGHPGAQLFPAALAVSEKVGASGKDMLTAMVVGYEIAHRTARCWHDHHEVYQACGSWGSVACAAVAAKLMAKAKVEAKEVVKHALGIAEYHAPNLPMMRDIDHPAMVKHGIGWGAMNGIVSAELAERGFTGIPSILGFEKYCDWVSTLGSEYIMVEGVTFKRWSCCAWGHPAHLAALNLIKDNDIQVEDIAHLKAYVYHEGWRLSQRHPESTEEAQFSVKWPLAALLLDGEIGPAQVLERRFSDETIKALADKIEIVEDPEIDRMYQLLFKGVDSPDARSTSRVEITLTDGHVLSSGLAAWGDIQWDDASLEKKFRWLTGYVLDDEKIEQLVRVVWDFDSVPSVKELVRLLE